MHTEVIKKTRELAILPSIDLIRRWRDQFGIDVTRYFRGIDAIRIVECEQSGLVSFEPLVVGDEVLYRTLESYDWYYLEDKWEHRLSLRSVRPGARVLEVGCGRGAFLVKAKDLGAIVTGMELNKAAAQMAVARGVDIVQCEISEPPAGFLHSFDLVAAFQVVEHVADPFDFCERLYSFVKRGGALHIAVPNRGSFMRFCETVLDLPPHHTTRWNRRTLAYLGKRIGAQEIRLIDGPLEPIHVDLYLALWRQRLGRSVLNRMSTPIARALLNAGLRHFVSGHTIVGMYRR